MTSSYQALTDTTFTTPPAEPQASEVVLVDAEPVLVPGLDGLEPLSRARSSRELAALLADGATSTVGADLALSRVVQLAQRRIPLGRFEAAAEGLFQWASQLSEYGFNRLAAFVFRGYPPLTRIEHHRAALVGCLLQAVREGEEANRALMLKAAEAIDSPVVATVLLDHIVRDDWPDLVAALRASEMEAVRRVVEEDE